MTHSYFSTYVILAEVLSKFFLLFLTTVFFCILKKMRNVTLPIKLILALKSYIVGLLRAFRFPYHVKTYQFNCL